MLFSKLFGSSTLWVSVLLPVLKILAHGLFGIDIPWEVAATGVAAYGFKEAAGKVAQGKVDAASYAASGIRAPRALAALFAFFVAAVALAPTSSAQTLRTALPRVHELDGGWMPASYSSVPWTSFEHLRLEPNTPVRVVAACDVDFYFQVRNLSAPISGYQYGQGMQFELQTPLGTSNGLQVCSNVCTGALGTGELHESRLLFDHVFTFNLDWITTAGNLPTAWRPHDYGGMQDWNGVNVTPPPFNPPWQSAHRNGARMRLIVTEL